LWCGDVGARSVNIPPTFLDELLWTFMFSQYLGSKMDPKHPNQAILIPQGNIPSSWKQYAEKGVIRIQEMGDEYRLWKPYYFLMKWMQNRFAKFEFRDVFELAAEITSASSSPDKRKGYCFQRVLSLELLHPTLSNFWKLIVNELKKLGLSVLPKDITNPKVKFFKTDNEIEQDRVCNAQDVKCKGEKRTTKKKADICGMRVQEQDTNGTIWEVSIEAKNYTSKQNDKLNKFYERVYQKNKTETKEIYIYVSLNPFVDILTVQSRKKTNKVFLLINGIKSEDCSLDIHFLSRTNLMTVDELAKKLIPSITTTPTLLNPIPSLPVIRVGLFKESTPDQMAVVQVSPCDDCEHLRTLAIETFKLPFSNFQLQLKKGTNVLNPLHTLVESGIQDKDQISFSVLGLCNSE